MLPLINRPFTKETMIRGYITSMSKLDEDNNTVQSNILLRQQIKMEVESVSTLSDAYAQQRSRNHDFNNHIAALQALLSTNNFEQATEYVDKITDERMESTLIINSNNLM